MAETKPTTSLRLDEDFRGGTPRRQKGQEDGHYVGKAAIAAPELI